MKNFRAWLVVLVLVVLAIVAGFGWYAYDQSQPLTEKECRATMFESVSARDMGYDNMHDLEADLRECGYSDREIAMWHAGDFAFDYSRGIMATEEGDGLLARYRHAMLFISIGDIPSFFKTDGMATGCGDGQYVRLSFVQEIKQDETWTMFSYNGGPETWKLDCAKTLR